MSTVFAVPLQAGVPQTFGIQLSGVTYQVTFKYRADPGGQGGWFMDISDSAGNPILQGAAVVTGADLLAQYDHLGFVGQLIGQTLSNPDLLPTFADFGGDFQLFYVTNP